MDDLDEARRLMQLVAHRATEVGEVDPLVVINMAKVWAHMALAEATRQQVAQLTRIADTLEERNS